MHTRQLIGINDPEDTHKCTFIHLPIFSHFTPKTEPKRTQGGAANLSTLGWRYQKRGSPTPNLSILGKKPKPNLSAFDWRYQKRGFYTPFPMFYPNFLAPALTFPATQKLNLRAPSPSPIRRATPFASILRIQTTTRSPP
jgi:hypothetical protein